MIILCFKAGHRGIITKRQLDVNAILKLDIQEGEEPVEHNPLMLAQLKLTLEEK